MCVSKGKLTAVEGDLSNLSSAPLCLLNSHSAQQVHSSSLLAHTHTDAQYSLCECVCVCVCVCVSLCVCVCIIQKI